MDPTRSAGDSSLEKARKRRERHEGQLRRMYPSRAIVVRWMLDESDLPWVVEVMLDGAPVSEIAWEALRALGLPLVCELSRDVVSRRRLGGAAYALGAPGDTSATEGLRRAGVAGRTALDREAIAAGPGGAVVLGERRAVGA